MSLLGPGKGILDRAGKRAECRNGDICFSCCLPTAQVLGETGPDFSVFSHRDAGAGEGV